MQIFLSVKDYFGKNLHLSGHQEKKAILFLTTLLHFVLEQCYINYINRAITPR